MIKKEEHISTYFKYFSDRNIENVILKKTIRFTQPWMLNDPFEFNPVLLFDGNHEQDFFSINGVLMPSINDFYRYQLIESQINDYGVLSLTKNPFSFDMWNYYANGHKGFIIELKPDFNNHESFKSKDKEIYPINAIDYIDKFEIDIAKLSNGEGRFKLENFNKKFFFQKTNRWEYEQEYRLVRSLKDFGKEFNHSSGYREEKVYCGELPFEVINSITFGAHMSKENKKIIIETVKGTDINIFQALVNKNELDEYGKLGKITLFHIDSNKKMNMMKQMAPQLLSFDGEFIAEKETVILDKIEDLPYYNFYKEIVMEMFENRKKSTMEKYEGGNI